MQIAQLNIGRLLAPLESPRIRGFVVALEPINALADEAPGFVWRLQTEDGDATAIRAFDDDMLIVNLSVWTSIETLTAYVYDSVHVRVMRRRKRWFAPMRDHFMTLWWVPDGERPTPAEARARLEHLREHGPTPHAFTFTTPFTADGEPALVRSDDPRCPA